MYACTMDSGFNRRNAPEQNHREAACSGGRVERKVFKLCAQRPQEPKERRKHTARGTRRTHRSARPSYGMRCPINRTTTVHKKGGENTKVGRNAKVKKSLIDRMANSRAACWMAEHDPPWWITLSALLMAGASLVILALKR